MLDPCADGQEKLKMQGGFLQTYRLGHDAEEAHLFPDCFGSSWEGQGAWMWYLHVLILTQSCQRLCSFYLA